MSIDTPAEPQATELPDVSEVVDGVKMLHETSKHVTTLAAGLTVVTAALTSRQGIIPTGLHTGLLMFALVGSTAVSVWAMFWASLSMMVRRGDKRGPTLMRHTATYTLLGAVLLMVALLEYTYIALMRALEASVPLHPG